VLTLDDTGAYLPSELGQELRGRIA
jgi:hypothetical protein